MKQNVSESAETIPSPEQKYFEIPRPKQKKKKKKKKYFLDSSTQTKKIFLNSSIQTKKYF